MIWVNEMVMVEKIAVEDAVTMARRHLCSIDDDNELAIGQGMREALSMLKLWPESEGQNSNGQAG